MRRKAVVAICGLGLCGAVAQADTLFFEDFNGYTSFPDQHPDGDPVNFGLPSISKGADNDWYGGRFEFHDGGTINNDVAVQEVGGSGNNTPVGRVEDEAALLFHVSTTNFTNVLLDFDWRLFSGGTSDRLVVGYYLQDIDFANDAPDGANDNRVRNFFTQGPAWPGNWVELMRDNSNTFQHETFPLPSGEAHIWVAFWMDNGEGDFAKIDNIGVTGIPEPAGLALLALGGMALLRRKR